MSFLKSVHQLSDWLVVFSEPSLNVVAKRLREASAGGSTFEMSCTVSTQNLGEAGYSVLIQSQESMGSTVRTIMTLSPDNVVQHGGATDPNRRYTPRNIMSTHNFTVMHWNLHFILKYIHLCLSTQGQSGSNEVWSGRVSVSPGRCPVDRQRFLLVRHHGVDKTAARPSLDQSHKCWVEQSQDRLSRKRWVTCVLCSSVHIIFITVFFNIEFC